MNEYDVAGKAAQMPMGDALESQDILIDPSGQIEMKIPMNADAQVPYHDQSFAIEQRGISTDWDDREDLSGFQRISAGFFAQTHEPALTINGNKISVNATATRLFPNVDYMEILINPDEKKVAFKPCDELSISGYKWARNKGGKRYALQRTGLPFVLCLCRIMGWDPSKRYRILGKKLRSETDEEILLFDLHAGQSFERAVANERRRGLKSTILTGWDGIFGPPYSESSNSLHVDTFDGYTVFSIKNRATDPSSEGTAEKAAVKDSFQRPDAARNDAGIQLTEVQLNGIQNRTGNEQWAR